MILAVSKWREYQRQVALERTWAPAAPQPPRWRSPVARDAPLLDQQRGRDRDRGRQADQRKDDPSRAALPGRAKYRAPRIATFCPLELVGAQTRPYP